MIWPLMANLLEYVGTIHIFLGPYRGNPIALYLNKGPNGCEIAPRAYPWKDVVGKGETPNRAAADFEEKWKASGLSPDMYTGPAWEGGIKPEKPAPPKPATPKPAAAASTAANAKPQAGMPPSGDSPTTAASSRPPIPSQTGTIAPSDEPKTGSAATTPAPSDQTAPTPASAGPATDSR